MPFLPPMSALARRAIAAFLGVLLLAAGPCRAEAAPVPELLHPAPGATLASPTPTLAWRATGADRVVVSIDGLPGHTLPGEVTQFVPFPLSFGAHRWQVTAFRGDEQTHSAEGRFVIDDRPLQALPTGGVLLRHDWRVESSERVGEDGARLSRPGVDTSAWAQTSVPATVLTALVRNGVYPNPYVALNNTRIPDANDRFNARFDLLRFSHIPGKNPWKRPYWYRTSFAVPASFAGKRVRLSFNEINYRADVWLNGVRLAEARTMVGMDRSFAFDVTDAVRRDGENVLAVAIHPLDHPGMPEPAPVTPLADPGRNMGADMDISLDYTKWDTVGWDWQPEVRDRDMGITEDVVLSPFEDVEIQDVYVATELKLPDVSRAGLLLSYDVVNHGTSPRRGRLRATVSDERGVAASVEAPVTLAAGATRHIEWTPRNQPRFVLHQPRLWWPAGLGEPHRYTLRVEFQPQGGAPVVAQPVAFGVRKLETALHPVAKSRVFKVNGREVYGQGGNWVMDMMLNWTASRYEQEIATARQSHLNFLRIWGPTGAPPAAFYDAADREGVMLQQDFLHDHWGTERNTPGYAPPLDVYEAATTAIIKKYRNHPALFLWCGGNEGPNPREALITQKLLPTYDPWGTRYYLNASLADGLQGGGPYHNLPARAYFNNPKIAGFNSEIGPSGLPEWESLRDFLTLPITDWAPGRFPLDGTWAYHDATDRPGADERRKFSLLDDLIRQRYGAPATTDLAGLRDYAAKAQLLNHETYQAAIEALNAHLWEQSTGFALWKYNSSWPSLLWQVTDWYQRLHAGSYSLRRALEPLHVQMNLDDRRVAVINRGAAPVHGLVVQAELFDNDMRSVWKQEQPLETAKPGASPSAWAVPNRPGLSFLKLRLRQGDKTVSDNFYWLEPNDDFKALASLPQANVALQVARGGPAGSASVIVTNRGSGPALLVRLRLLDAPSGVEVLPAAWTDNYLDLLPGEQVSVSLTTRPGELPKQPAVEVSGWRLPATVVNF